MEKDDNKSYIDIVDIPPIETESLFIVNESVGSTELSKEQFNSLFKGRNLVFISTYLLMDFLISLLYGPI
jgi:hypothetical protein